MRCSKREEKFWTFDNNCVLPEANCLIPEAGRFPEPSAEDNFAVFFWHSSGRKFFGTRKRALDFITSEAAEGCEWIGPLPISETPTMPHSGPDFPSFREHVRQLGTLRQAGGVSIERAWDDLIARGFDSSDRTSLSACYLRAGGTRLRPAQTNGRGIS